MMVLDLACALRMQEMHGCAAPASCSPPVARAAQPHWRVSASHARESAILPASGRPQTPELYKYVTHVGYIVIEPLDRSYIR